MRKLIVLAALVACAPPETPTFKLKHAEQRGRIDSNGLRFVIMPDATTTLVEVDVRFEVGAKEDPRGKAGLAHLVEHLLFQIRPAGPNTPTLMDHLNQLAVARNAYTTWDKTHYMTLAPAGAVEALLQIEAIRLHLGCNEIPQAEFEREREVVRNEIRQRFGSPQGQIWPKALAAIYPEGHAYARMPGGDDEQIASITLADACEFVKQHYTPDRATVIVSGGVDVQATVQLVGKWFSKIPRRTPAARAHVTRHAVGGKRKTIKLDIERPVVVVAWALPDLSSAAGEAVEDAMIEAMLGTARTANEWEFANEISFTGRLGGTNAATIGLVLELPNMGKLDDALDFTFKAARGANRLFTGFSSFEEWRARRQATMITNLEPLFQGRNDAVADLVQFRPYDFNSRELYVFQELDAIRKLGEGTIRDVVVSALDPAKAQVVVFEPNKAGPRGDRRSTVKFTPSVHEPIDSSNIDPTEATKRLVLPKELSVLSNAKRFELKNGMDVVLLPVAGMPIVNVQLAFGVGTASTPDRPLLAAAAADLLQWKQEELYSAAEAATSLPARLWRAGIPVRCRASTDVTQCSASGINIYVEDMIEGLEQLTKRGEYDQRSVEGMQKSMRTRFALRRTQDRNEMARQQMTALFGADHPYTKVAFVSKDAIGKFGRDALWSFRDKHYSAANATLVIVGGFDVGRVESAVRSRFGDWGKGHDDPPVTAPPAARKGPTFTGVVGEESPQLVISILYPSAPGIGGMRAPRLILDKLLDVRAAKVRESLGASYGISARRIDRRGPSYYEIAGTIDAPRAGEALKALRDSIDTLRTQNFDADFVLARRQVVRDLLGQANTSSVLASRLAQVGAFNLPPNYYEALLEQIAAVSPAQVKAIIDSELDAKLEVVVTLGDRKTIDKAFADAGIPDVTIVEVKQ